MNDIQKSCVEHLKSEGFNKQRLESFSRKAIPEAPKPPEVPEHPLGDDYLAVVELIGDWKQRAIAAEKELESLRKSFEAKQTIFSSDIEIKKLSASIVEEMFNEYFGEKCFPHFRTKLREKLGI